MYMVTTTNYKVGLKPPVIRRPRAAIVTWQYFVCARVDHRIWRSKTSAAAAAATTNSFVVDYYPWN